MNDDNKNTSAGGQFGQMEKKHEADERMRIMFDATPLSAHFWDENLKIVDCNQAAVTMFNLSGKQEYIDKYFDLTPEFQPDGSRSTEKLKYHIDKTYKDGYQQIEWMRQTLDGKPIPVELTLVRVNYKGKNLIAGYCRDLREQKRMMADIDRRDNFLYIMNRIAAILLAASNEEHFENTMVEALEFIGRCLNADCVQVWPNEMRDDVLHFVLKYKWLSSTGREAVPVAIGTPVPYTQRWMELFLRNEYINGPIAELPEEDQALLSPLGISSTITIPLFYHDKFWGVFCVDDCIKQRYFTDGEIGILRSAALMLVNFINRNLQEAEHRLQLTKLNVLVKAAKIGLWDMEVVKNDPVNPGNRFKWSNDFRRMLGYTDENDFPNIFSSWSNRVHPDDRERIIEAFKNHILDTTGNTPYDLEYRMFKKNGECAYYRDTGETIRDDDGTPIHAIGALIDVTETKENLLNNELQILKLHLVVHAAKIGLWDMEVVRDDPVNINNYFMWSDDFRRMLGFNDESDFPNRFSSWSERLHPEDKERVIGAFARHIQDTTGRTPYDEEYRLLKKNNEYAYYRASGETIRDENGNAVRVSGSLLDITETKNLIFEAESQRAAAEEANKAKSSFLSTMSHEIRTPMNVILGITEIQLMNDALTPDIRDSFEKIYTSGDLLLNIINDILDLSKIEAGKLELLIDDYEIASLVSDTVQLNMMRIGSREIEFELHVDENIPARFKGDVLRVKQILNNILSNAFKYTAAGTVKMSVTAEPVDNSDEEVVLIIKVSDTGQGMTEEQIGRLFDEYSRFNQEANRTTEGTGLGMSITLKLVQLMNGEIFVDSEPGKGSVFTVRIPQGQSGSGALGREMAENLNQFRSSSRTQMKRVLFKREQMPYGSVLIVDDVETNLYVAKGLMVPYGLKIETAESGYEAIEKIKNGKMYDIIFMDHMMPKMDGVEATKILRGMGYKRPIVALTANAVAGQAVIFLGNGFDDFISKPIDIRQLNLVLNKLIRDRQPPEVLNAVRQQADVKKGPSGDTTLQQLITPRLIGIFIRDTLKALATLEEISAKNDYSNEDNLRSYIINVHGVKGTLATIGKMDLSAAALKLEIAGREERWDILMSETPVFLKLLRAFVEELEKKNKTAAPVTAGAGEIVNEDKPYLLKMLNSINASCLEYDENSADKTLAELKKAKWTKQTDELLTAIAGLLLHSDFDEIVNIINRFMKTA